MVQRANLPGSDGERSRRHFGQRSLSSTQLRVPAAVEPGSFDATAGVEMYAYYCLCSNVHQFAVEHETEAAHGDLAHSLGYHVVCVCVCRACVSESGGRGRGLLEDRL